MGGFGAAIVLRVQAPENRLRFVFKQQHFVDHRQRMLNLQLGERAADGKGLGGSGEQRSKIGVERRLPAYGRGQGAVRE